MVARPACDRRTSVRQSNMPSSVDLQGIMPVVPTCFDENGLLDLDSQVSLIRYYLRCGVQGLQMFGNASEYYTLSEAEQSAILDLVCREAAAEVPVIVTTGGGGLEDAVKWIRMAADHGAAAVLLRPPAGVRKEDPRAALPYYLELSLGTNIQIVIQDAVMGGQLTLPAALYRELERMIGRISYIKVEVPWTVDRLRHVALLMGGRVRLLAGQNGLFMIEEKQAGAVGSMVGSDMTPHYLRVWQHCEQRQWTQAWTHFMRLLPLIRFQMQNGMGASAIKHNLVAEGAIRCARVRPPTPALNGFALEELTFLRNLVGVAIEVSAA
jgi:2-keto-3-deoxy-L-arabinonate dehydratase